MAEKLNPFNKFLEAEVWNNKIKLKEASKSVNKAHNDACELAMKQPIPRKQLLLMIDVNFRSTGYALMIEDNPDYQIQSKMETYAPVALESKISSSHN